MKQHEEKNNKEEHLYSALKDYAASDFYPYHMPGHKRRLWGAMPGHVMEMDITEIEGFDNLHQPEGILRRLQERAASLYGAEESFYLVNGSTGGILSAISAALPVGGHLLMARNCHKSVYHAVYLRNLTVSYLYPERMEEYDINDVITPQQIEAALKREPDINAVLVVSPTYEGRIAEIEHIAEIVHRRNIPLIVDEAHGAHLGMCEEVSRNSCQAGADLVIHSVHKTLPAMTQTALLHVNGNRVDRDHLRRFLHIYQTSSPSYVLMASIDNALTLMEEQGRELFARFCGRYEEMVRELSQCRCLEFLPPEKGRQDVGKLIISGKKFGLSGQRLYDILLKEYHLQSEMAEGSYCLAMFTVGDDEEAYERMTAGLLDIDKRMANGMIESDMTMQGISFAQPDCSARFLSISAAWDMPYEKVKPEQAIGRVVGEFINLYPPGIPLLVPGEFITEEICRQIVSYLDLGLNVQGVEEVDGDRQIRVLRK